ncbi:LysR family transcriptional regulator [Corallococcus exercitus]|uniref:LysR family transcriptional regulator n=2 Tax=Corallococcus exercitus TaxID=2316736 RepID=A0A3A8HLG4_9BACT|nr:LysR family transcriptional regulator [Corallococcus exercitus]RKG66681.1 LysR family transcriptional regulator [Corallococcus exercitus]
MFRRMKLASVDLNLLVALEALLREGSVTKAGHSMGLSTPAMSHALARLRTQLDDPLLVRAGRGMVLTPRAVALRPRLQALLSEVGTVLSPARTFEPAKLERTFRIHATDHMLMVLGPTLDRLVRREAPAATLQFLPNSPDDGAMLREGNIDLAVGVYVDLPPELRTRKLFTDRFVCVVRRDHPTVRRTLTLEQYLSLEHLQVAPRGRPGGYVDTVLAVRNQRRRVARAVPYFLTGLQWVEGSDYVLTISERVAKALAPRLKLKLLPPPLPLEPYTLTLLWHPREDADPAHRWLRDVFVRAARAAAP